MKISNTMKIKQQDGSFEDVKISYIEPNYCTAEGEGTTASKACSHAEGNSTTASGEASHAEGYYTTASGDYSHAEGEGTIAIGKGAHAEGFYELSDKAILVTFYKESQTQPIYRAELENENNMVVYTGDIIQIDSKYYSIIKNTTFNFKINGDLEIDNGTKGYYFQRAGAAGDYSHSEGYNSEARGEVSHAEGEGTVAFSARQHVQGKYNIRDTNDTYAFIIGNGTDNESRSNALAVKWNGDVVIKNNALPLSPVYSGYVTAGSIGEIAANSYTDVIIDFPAEFFYDGKQPIVTPSLVHTNPVSTSYLSVTVPDRRIVDEMGTATIRIFNTYSGPVGPGLQYTVTPCLSIK